MEYTLEDKVILARKAMSFDGKIKPEDMVLLVNKCIVIDLKITHGINVNKGFAGFEHVEQYNIPPDREFQIMTRSEYLRMVINELWQNAIDNNNNSYYN